MLAKAVTSTFTHFRHFKWLFSNMYTSIERTLFVHHDVIFKALLRQFIQLLSIDK